MKKVGYEIVMKDSNGNEKKLNGMSALCEIMWDACCAIIVDYSNDPDKKELVKTANFVCKWVARLEQFFKKGETK